MKLTVAQLLATRCAFCSNVSWLVEDEQPHKSRLVRPTVRCNICNSSWAENAEDLESAKRLDVAP